MRMGLGLALYLGLLGVGCSSSGGYVGNGPFLPTANGDGAAPTDGFKVVVPDGGPDLARVDALPAPDGSQCAWQQSFDATCSQRSLPPTAYVCNSGAVPSDPECQLIAGTTIYCCP
jgi:hypothetical protein